MLNSAPTKVSDDSQSHSTLFRDIRILEVALRDGGKRVFPGEFLPPSRLRRIDA